MIISHQKDVGGPKLKRIKFFDTDLTSVSPEVMVGAIQRLEKVVLIGRITADHITAVLLMVINNRQGRLKYIEFELSCSEDFVPPNLSTLIPLARQNNAVRIKFCRLQV